MIKELLAYGAVMAVSSPTHDGNHVAGLQEALPT
jgi:hypothetical protein